MKLPALLKALESQKSVKNETAAGRSILGGKSRKRGSSGGKAVGRAKREGKKSETMLGVRSARAKKSINKKGKNQKNHPDS